MFLIILIFLNNNAHKIMSNLLQHISFHLAKLVDLCHAFYFTSTVHYKLSYLAMNKLHCHVYHYHKSRLILKKQVNHCTFILRSIGKIQFTFTMLFSFRIVAFISCVIRPYFNSKTLLLIIFPLIIDISSKVLPLLRILLHSSVCKILCH